MPHQKLNIFWIFANELIPRKVRIINFTNLIILAIKYKLHELFLIEYGNFQYFQFNLFSIVETFPNILKISYWLVTIQVFLFVFDFEDKLVRRIFHGDHHSIVLENNSIYCSDHFVYSVLSANYEAISFTSIVVWSGGVPPFLDFSIWNWSYPRCIFVLIKSLRLSFVR